MRRRQRREARLQRVQRRAFKELAREAYSSENYKVELIHPPEAYQLPRPSLFKRLLAVLGLGLLLLGCSTARRVVCPAPRVLKVVETDHGYVVTLVAECREYTQEVTK